MGSGTKSNGGHPRGTLSRPAELAGLGSGLFMRFFILTSGLILAITGVAKVWTGLGNSKFLAVVDPIIGIKFGQLMLLVGVAEIAVALVCFFSKRQTLALGLVAWMSTTLWSIGSGCGGWIGRLRVAVSAALQTPSASHRKLRITS
jgi:hypothetical protein